MRRPLAKAFATRDDEVVGELMTASQSGVQLVAGKIQTTARHLAVPHKYGLLADDPATDPALLFRLSAAVTGAFLLEGAPGMGDLGLADKADALAITLRRAVEPAAEPPPRARCLLPPRHAHPAGAQQQPARPLRVQRCLSDRSAGSGFAGPVGRRPGR